MSEKEVKIGLLGCGTVGSGVYKILHKNKSSITNKAGTQLSIKKVLVRNKDKELAVDVPYEELTEDFNDILEDDEIDIVVELIGGVDPAKEFVIKSLENGKSVVTANKELIAKYGSEILSTAGENEVDIYFEASVGGGIPIIKPLKSSLAANKITKILGIVNGTTNYILTKMDQEGAEFDSVLEQAQELGYAEADPSSDIEGCDAAYKLAILSSIGFESRVEIDKVHVEGITNITGDDISFAQEFDYKIKLLAIGKEGADGIEVRVHPTLIPQDHPLANVNDVFNAIFIEGDAIDRTMFYGPGAGQMPTGSAVVGDIIEVARNIQFDAHGRLPCTCFDNKKIKDPSEIETRYYIRLEVLDKPGVLGKITNLLGEYDVSMESVMQKGRSDQSVPLVLITHKVKEGNMNAALEEIADLEPVKEVANLIRVEE